MRVAEWAERPIGGRGDPVYRGAMNGERLTNLDLLEWFGEDERGDCTACGRRACVSLPDVAASFCLGCGAITIGGMRIDAAGAIPLEI